MVVSFSGIDSSGKSTQIELLKKYCDEHSIKSKVIWSKARATPVVEFIKKIVRKDRKLSHEEKLKHREEIFSNGKKKKLLLFASLSELCFYWGIYFRILSATNKCLILDRYLWDTYAEIKADFYGINFESQLMWKILSKVATKPQFSILFAVPLEVSLSRDIRKTSAIENNPAVIDSVERKTEKVDTYFKLMKENKWTNVIDGTRQIDDIHKDIITLLGFEE